MVSEKIWEFYLSRLLEVCHDYRKSCWYCYQYKKEGQTRVVAVDNVGAGVGEIVLVSTGSAARVGSGNENSPVDACVVGIVDDPDKIVIEK